MITVLEPGRSSWTAPLEALHLGPGEDAAAVTTRQLRDILGRLIQAWQWHTGDPKSSWCSMLGYDATQPAFLLADLPVQVLGWMRSYRALPRLPGTIERPSRHGGNVVKRGRVTHDMPKSATEVKISQRSITKRERNTLCGEEIHISTCRYLLYGLLVGRMVISLLHSTEASFESPSVCYVRCEPNGGGVLRRSLRYVIASRWLRVRAFGTTSA